MGSNYLTGDPFAYGLPDSVPTPLAEQASAIVDAYLKRPEGLAYQTDSTGAPIFMAAASPSMTYTLTGGAAPGSGVAVTVSPALVKPDMVGEVLILDAKNPSLREACVVASTNGNNQITLGSVINTHAAGATASAGLVLTEERNMPSKRSIARVAKWPIANVLSLLGRYAYGRRSDQVGGLYQEMNLLASVQTFGGPPQWIPVSTEQCSWSDATGEIWVPAGMLMAYYSDVKIKYVAGYRYDAVPSAIMKATAAVASALLANSNFGGQIKTLSAGGSSMTRFFASNVDADIMRALAPYIARTMF